jgi:hypothetical protein
MNRGGFFFREFRRKFLPLAEISVYQRFKFGFRVEFSRRKGNVHCRLTFERLWLSPWLPLSGNIIRNRAQFDRATGTPDSSESMQSNPQNKIKTFLGQPGGGGRSLNSDANGIRRTALISCLISVICVFCGLFAAWIRIHPAATRASPPPDKSSVPLERSFMPSWYVKTCAPRNRRAYGYD